ncbi:MAG: PAS domain S-box protein [Phycisphaerae bacterium]|nr:PAS domain S-box protein [Phycisphaerae bacterium]
MQDKDESRKQLLDELETLRRRNRELEASVARLERVEQALLAGESRYRSLVENLPVKVFIKSPDSVFISCNRSFAEDLGLEPEDLCGKTDHDFYPTDLADKYRADDRRILESGSTEELDEKHVRDGQERFVRTIKTPVKDEAGNVTGILGAFWDITDRRRAESESARWRALLEAVIDQSPVGIMVAEASDCRVFIVNKEAQRINGQTREKQVQVSLRDRQEMTWSCFYPDGTPWPPLELPLPKAAVRAESTENQEMLLRRADGTESLILCNAAPIRDDQGTMIAGVVTFLDVTARSQMAEALRASEEKHRLAMEAATDGLWDWDVSAGQVYYSPVWSSILEEKEVEPTYASWETRLHPQDRQRVLSSLRGHLDGHTHNWHCEHRLRTGGGQWKWVVGRGRVVDRDAEGRPLRMVGTMTDIGKRKQAEQGLERANTFLRAVIEQAPFGIQVCEGTADDWELTTINKEAQRIIGVPEQQHQGLGWAEGRPKRPEKSTWKMFRADGSPWPPEQAPLVAAMLEGKVTKNEEMIIRRPDGTEFTILCNAAPIYDGGGALIGGIVTYPDVTERKKALQALLESEERYRLLVETMRDGLAVQRDGRLTFVNQSFCRMLGYSPNELIGRNMIALLDEPNRLEFDRQMVRRRKGAADPYELELTGRGGRKVYTLVSPQPAFEEDGVYRGSFGVFTDITGRKRAEEAMRASEANYRAIFDSANDAIFVHDAETGAILDVNLMACEVCGYEKDDLCRLTVGDFSAGEPPYTQEEALKWIAKALQGRPQVFEWEGKTKDGQPFWVEVSLKCAEIDGKRRVLSIAREIADRKRAEEALRASEANYRAIFDSANDAIFVHDATTGRILDVNRKTCEMFGYAAHELRHVDVGQISSAAHPYTDEQAMIKVEKAAEGHPQIFEWQARSKDGRLFWVEVSLKRVEIGGRPCVLAIARDIADRKQAEDERRRLEAQIQHAQKLESLGVLAGGIAHDFNNLLVAILGNAELALMDLSPVSPALESIQAIEAAGRRAADLCRQMLAYSGKGKFIVEPIDLNEVVTEMAHLLEVSISKKVALRYHLAGGLPSVEADATQIRQIIMNLITNASEAVGQESGVISIGTGAMNCDRPYLSESYLDDDLPAGRYVYLEVTDTGCGMDDETRRKLFDPFFTTKFTGRGLGMAAVLGIVRGHKGAIKVYTEPGRGTTFKILLPEHGGPAQPLASEPADEMDWSAFGTVLLVDDEEAVRSICRQVLEKVGFTVLAAEDGRQALDLFREHPDEIVCVLLDLTMPNMDGEETFRELRRIRKDVRVILASGYNEQEVINRFAGKGLAGFIQKPYELRKLIAKMRQILEGPGGHTDAVSGR